MIVKDLILYQVATDRDYKVGDKIIFDASTQNGQFNRVYNFSFKIDSLRPSDIVYSNANKKFGRFKNKETLYQLANRLEYYDVLVKELALEEVRQEKFSNLPSRLHSMYLSLSKEAMLENFESMASSLEKKGKHFQAVAVKCNGNIFKAGKFYMSREAESYDYYRKKAYGYWGQKDLKDEEVKEILFQGEAEIVEIFAEIKK